MQTRTDMSVVRLLLPYLKPYRWRVLVFVAALLVASSLVIALGPSLRWLVDEGLAARNPAALDQALIGLGVGVVLLAGATFTRFYFISWLGERVIADIRRQVYSHLLTLSLDFYESARAGDLQARLQSDTAVLQTVIGSSLSVAIRNTLLIIGGLFMMFVSNASLAFLVIGLVPVVVLPVVVFGRRAKRLARLAQDKIGDVGVGLDETLYGIRTVQAFGREEYETVRFHKVVERAFDAALARILNRSVMTALVMMLAFGATGVILWQGGHDVLAGTITSGQLSAFLFYAVLVAAAAGAISEVMSDIQRASAAMARVQELLEKRSNLMSAGHAAAVPNWQADPLVVFDKVDFTYAARPDNAALSEVSLTIRRGEKVAFVGASGAGKSTILQLLQRFYDPQAGAVRVAGADVRDLTLPDLRAGMALVPQDPLIFSGTVLENIAYALPDLPHDAALSPAMLAAVEDAAKAAHAHDFIMALPDGYHTYLGEKGVRLSGGQRQRLALARALLRKARILLLDEATSALDSLSEKYVQDAIMTQADGRTVVVIAHRLATIRACDRIFVMESGRLIAVGTHAELMQQEGVYQRLARLQFDAGENA